MLAAAMLLQVLAATPATPAGVVPDPAFLDRSNLSVQAIRTPVAIKIDGVLDDSIWAQARPMSNFIQRQPKENAPPSQRTEVRVLFDDNAIYVGATMYDHPDSVMTQLARRDNWVSADRFFVFLDTYR